MGNISNCSAGCLGRVSDMERGSVIDNIKRCYGEMYVAEKKVADFILANPERAIGMNISGLAEGSGASDATVIRFCKHIGYKGFYQMKLVLAQDLGREQMILGRIPKSPDTLDGVFKDIASNILNITNFLDTSIFKKVVELIHASDTVHVVAVGNTLPLAADFSYRLGRLGVQTTDSFFPEHHLHKLTLAGPNDIAVAVSMSGASSVVLQTIEVARECSVPTVALTDALDSPLEHMCDYTLSTGAVESCVHGYGANSHVYVAALIDALLYFISKDSKTEHVSRIETYLSDWKV